LTDRDLEKLAVEEPHPLPASLAALVRLEASSDQAIGRGDFRLYLASAVGPPGARLLGRFCHADPELAEWVERHLQAEEALQPDAVFAEVIHLPEGRLGNILARPAWRSYEIPYLAQSSLPAERQIPISDLRISVNGERVVLRSARLGREVIPRLTSAHNYSSGPAIYRFLCALQGQGVAGGLSWNWGPLDSSAFLPRVAFGRLVLARAQWRVTTEEIACLKAAPEGKRWDVFQRWREQRRLPRWICLAEGDNELPIDLENSPMVRVMLDQLKNRPMARLIELFPHPDRLCVRGDEGGLTHEMVVPFISPARNPQMQAPARFERNGRGPAATQQRRVFNPGSESAARRQSNCANNFSITTAKRS
jgi:hypothetical protein